MSNHFHLAVYYAPSARLEWSDVEVVDRWLHACPPRSPDGTIDTDLREVQRAAYLSEPAKVSVLRDKLGSLSVFMNLLKQPIAPSPPANREFQTFAFTANDHPSQPLRWV